MTTILVVDDEWELTEIAAYVLETAGFEVLEAHNASAALELLARRHVDLVVTDVMMPGMDGVELAEEIHRQRRLAATKILAVSAAPEYLVLTKDHFFDAFLAKPFSAGALLEQVSYLLEGPK